MKINEFNKNQKNAMKRNIIKDYYEWDNKKFFSYIIGEIPLERERYRYSGKELTKEQIKQNEIICKINEIIKRYNYSMKIKTEDLEELEHYYLELDKYIERYYTSYSDIMNALKFNKVVWISGPGGIGKSQFLYEFSEKLEKKFNYLCIYGKYCEKLEDSILIQIQNIIKKDKFYFIIDAINELNKSLIEKIKKFINENKNNENLRVIISYRDFSMNQLEVDAIKTIVDEEEIFSGVSADYALEKISEKYNLDLSVYSRLLYDNNPLHLKLIIKTISENQLINRDLNPIAKGTYIYEQFIKQVLSRDDWNLTKDIVEIMFKNKSKEFKLSDINKIQDIDIETYINKMKMNNFIGTYEFENEIYIYFINETLTDYLISRFLFEKINGLDINSVIKYINDIVKVFYSIHSLIIMMLFEKYEDRIEIAIKIIKGSCLKDYLDVDIFNEIVLSDSNIQKVQKCFHLNYNIKDLLIIAGGNENNPFNCKNYLNDKLKQFYKHKQIEFDRYDVRRIRHKLKIYVQTMSKFDYEDNYVEEKFWFAVWCSTSVNKVNRALSQKLIFEITNNDSKYINILILIYKEINDEYVKEMIIQVLCSLKKDISNIKEFLNKINTKEMINSRNLYFISSYLYGYENYEEFTKINLLEYADKRKNRKILNFLHRTFFTFKYDYDFFGFDSYNSSIKFSTKFIEEDKNNIIKINNFINENFKCLDNEECHSVYFKENFIDNNFKINEKYISDNKIYLAWQQVFKKYLKIYNIKIKDLDDTHVYEEDEKNIVFKALDLSFSEINGAMTCNFYTKDFELYGKYKGYQFNCYDKYDEKSEIYYPISVFNPKIENLDNKIIKKIVLPTKKNIKWVKDSELNLENIKRIIQPIKYNNEEWCMIYGHIRLDEKSDNEYGNEWIDTYIVNLAIDEDYNLCNISDLDRNYTIDTQRYRGNLEDFITKEYKRTVSLYSSSELRDIYVTTDFNLPPTIIIRELNLHYNKFTSSWNNIDEQEIILTNNNEGIWYRSGCSGTLYLKKKYYDQLLENHNYKYFGFTEKFHPKTGYCDDSALQLQINPDNTIIKYKHYKSKKRIDAKKSDCYNCIVYKKEKEDSKRWNNKFNALLFEDDL